MSGADKIIQKTSDIFNIPGDVATGAPVIEIIGFNRVRVDSHKGVLEYGDKLIDISGGKTIIRINGGGLEIRSMNSETLVVTGYIKGIDFIAE